MAASRMALAWNLSLSMPATFDAEDLVFPDQQSADLVVEVFAQSQDFVPDGVDAVLGFEPTSPSFLPAGLLFLPAPELFQVLVEWLWIFVVGQFGIDCEGLTTAHNLVSFSMRW